MKIRQQVVDWLLEEDNPPVRFLTLTRLLHEGPRSKVVREAKSRLMDYPVTQRILKHAPDLWKGDDRAFWKYDGKYWQLIFLGQFLADGKDPRIAEGVRGLLATRRWVTTKRDCCLAANILGGISGLGYGGHPVVKEEMESLAERFLDAGGIACSYMDYSLLSHCYMAQPRLLLCFGQIPTPERSRRVTTAIERLVYDLVQKEVFVYMPVPRKDWEKEIESRPSRRELAAGETVKGWVAARRREFLARRGEIRRKPKPGWLKFGFPLHYNSDVLEALYALALVSTPMSTNLEKALEVVRAKRTEAGTWILDKSMNGKMLADVEEQGRPSKWLTFRALYVLNHFRV
ncbi:MAG: hypothetical protein GY856_48090 [bacterium]|nr:hypothetical protein [bacterium]